MDINSWMMSPAKELAAALRSPYLQVGHDRGRVDDLDTWYCYEMSSHVVQAEAGVLDGEHIPAM